jgi:NitT/TauT family transport system ATP-binding protein
MTVIRPMDASEGGAPRGAWPQRKPSHAHAGGREARGRIQIDDVEIAFESAAGSLTAVSRIALGIEPGEFVCILGPSGCGKSTLLNAVAGFLRPTRGRLLLDGMPIVRPGPDRGMVFQQHSLFPWKTVLRNVMFGPLMAGHGSIEAESTARTFLDMVGLTAFVHAYPATLSGGMQQRVGIARALANYPTVLLMDEPFGALDAQTRAMMQETLLGLWDAFKITVLFVTHDIDEAVFLSDRVLVMSAAPGAIIADYRVDIERPRTSETLLCPAFTRLKRSCMELIRRESLVAFEQQRQRLVGEL